MSPSTTKEFPMQTETRSRYESGQPFNIIADRVQLHATAEQTGDAFFVMEVDVAPGGGPPPLHTHEAAEFFWTLHGELTYFRQEPDGTVTEITGGPGTWAYIPGGVPHTYRNFSATRGAYLAVLSPPRGMQEFLLAAAQEPDSAPADPEAVLDLGRRYGMAILDVVPEPRSARAA
jgi:mannose-6-phosphate isomerase-like protein (cupin superfamily)